jgi:hypothetical protein
MEEEIHTLVSTLFLLNEPWRGRFLAWMAKRSSEVVWEDGPQPGQEDVKDWLLADLGLCREVSLLLDRWQGANQ